MKEIRNKNACLSNFDVNKSEVNEKYSAVIIISEATNAAINASLCGVGFLVE